MSIQMRTGWETGKGIRSSEFHPARLGSETVTDFPIHEATPSERLNQSLLFD